MRIEIEGASENNIKDVSVTIDDGFTVVTGISGQEKLLLYSIRYTTKLAVDFWTFNRSRTLFSNKGGPTIAVEQNLLNRNPLPTSSLENSATTSE